MRIAFAFDFLLSTWLIRFTVNKSTNRNFFILLYITVNRRKYSIPKNVRRSKI